MSMEELSKSIENGEEEDARKFANEILESGVDIDDLIAVLTETMGRIGDRFAKLEIFLPELMMSGDAMAAVTDAMAPYMKSEGEQKPKAKMVIGVVKGDLHEIGKNIAKLMLETNGFEVKDLGYDVDSLTFIKEAEAMGADFIGASSLMTTTMPRQKEIIDILTAKGIRDQFKVVIGGAPTSQLWADSIGADLYVKDANKASEQMLALLS